jgi:hypothetical protein
MTGSPSLLYPGGIRSHDPLLQSPWCQGTLQFVFFFYSRFASLGTYGAYLPEVSFKPNKLDFLYSTPIFFLFEMVLLPKCEILAEMDGNT